VACYIKWQCKESAAHKIPLYALKVAAWFAMSVCKIRGPQIFKARGGNLADLKLSTQVFVICSRHSLQNLKDSIERETAYSSTKSSSVCLQIFSDGEEPGLKLEVSISQILLKNRTEVQGKNGL
jgi:hypothetical protein